MPLRFPRLVAPSVALAATCALTLGCRASESVEGGANPCADEIGLVRVFVTPTPSLGALWLDAGVGDSLRLTAEVRRIDAAVWADEIAFVGCRPTATTKVQGVVTFSTTATHVAQVREAGWVVGGSEGVVGVRASSPAAAEPTIAWVRVR